MFRGRNENLVRSCALAPQSNLLLSRDVQAYKRDHKTAIIVGAVVVPQYRSVVVIVIKVNGAAVTAI